MSFHFTEHASFKNDACSVLSGEDKCRDKFPGKVVYVHPQGLISALCTVPYFLSGIKKDPWKIYNPIKFLTELFEAIQMSQRAKSSDSPIELKRSQPVFS